MRDNGEVKMFNKKYIISNILFREFFELRGCGSRVWPLGSAHGRWAASQPGIGYVPRYYWVHWLSCFMYKGNVVEIEIGWICMYYWVSFTIDLLFYWQMKCGGLDAATCLDLTLISFGLRATTKKKKKIRWKQKPRHWLRHVDGLLHFFLSLSSSIIPSCLS